LAWLEYYVQLQKCLVANSAEEALQKIKPIAIELKKLAIWEKEGKIKGDGSVDSRGFQHIELLDESIGRELRQMELVIFYEIDECAPLDEYYPEFAPDYKPVKNRKTK